MEYERLDKASKSRYGLSGQTLHRQRQEYEVRAGTIDSGKDYELRMIALMALRCLHSDVEVASLAFNANECSDFDDMIIYRKVRGRRSVSLVQLKHQDKPSYIKADDFLRDKGNFSLGKYNKGFKEMAKNNFDSLKFMFDDEIDYNNIDLVLYTNRDALVAKPDKASQHITTNHNNNKQCNFLVKCDPKDHFLMTNPYGSVYKFNEYDADLQQYDKEFLKKVLLFVRQTNIQLINQLIMIEIELLFPDVNTHVNGNFVENFVCYISAWAKGQLGGHYTLTKNQISNVTTGLLFDLCVFEFCNLNRKMRSVGSKQGKSEDLKKYQLPTSIFSQIVTNYDILLITYDKMIINYLIVYINKLIAGDGVIDMFAMISRDQYNAFLERFPNLKFEISNRKENECTVLMYDVYRALWRLGEVPLILVVNDEHEFLWILNILSYFRLDRNFIILTEQDLQVAPNNLRILTHLSSINQNLRNSILDRNVKIQGRDSINLRNFVAKVIDADKVISTKDIVNILGGTFTIGDALNALPEFFIERRVPKVCVKAEVFNTKYDVFVVICTEKKRQFVNYLLQNKSLFSRFVLFFEAKAISQRDLLSKKCLITVAQNFDSKVQMFNRTTHYLKFHADDKMLIWLDTCGSLANIRQHLENIPQYDWLENKYCWQISTNNENPITSEFKSPVNIISAGPGMGKSIAMNAVALQAPVTQWVLRIDLNKYIDYFVNLKISHKQPSIHLDYFNTRLLEQKNCNTTLNKQIFKQFLNDKQILILFDGYDEISPSFKDTVTALIHALKDSDYYIWITTRPVMCSYAEKQFNSFAYTLNPFDKQDQVEFLKQYFKKFVRDSPKDKIDKFVEKLLNVTVKSLPNQEDDLMGIPLQTKMLAEVYLKECENYLKTNHFALSHNQDLLHLYEEFVRSKENEFVKKFGRDYSLRILSSSRECDMLYALKLLFKKSYLRGVSSCMKKKLKGFVEEVRNASNKIGIVILQDEMHLCFIHRTFAEYFAAVWLSENCENSPYQSTALCLIKKLSKPEYAVINNFFSKHLLKELRLHSAVMNGQVETVKSILIKDKKIITTTDKLGRTALHVLVTWSCQHVFPQLGEKPNETIHVIKNKNITELEIAKLLVENGLSYEKDAFGTSACRYALENNCLRVLNAYAQQFGYVKVPKDKRIPYLYYSIRYGYASLMAVIFDTYPETKININEQVSTSGRNFCHLAVTFENKFAIEILLLNGADINALNAKGNTVLHYAVSKGTIDTVKHLLLKQANINIQNQEGDTVLHYAVLWGTNDIIKLLLAHEVNVNAVNAKGYTALHMAAFSGKKDVIELLLQSKVDINKQSLRGETPLHLAVQESHRNVVEYLLLKNADVHLKRKNGQNALHITFLPYKQNKQRLWNKIDQHGNKIIDQMTLQGSIHFDKRLILKLLMDKQIDVHAKDNCNKTAFDYAFENGYLDVITKVL